MENVESNVRVLGDTGIEMSTLGFGCASVWGKTLITDEEARALFERAYELGIRYFDTGYSYGIAEERIGKILAKSKSVKRENLIISTKFGTKCVNGKYIHDFSPEWMIHSVETSLKRMGLEYIDLLLCHGPQIKDLTPKYLHAMGNLKNKGVIKAIGINTFDTDVIEYVRDTKCFDFVMLDYNILRQDREDIIKELSEKGIGVIAGAPLAESLYSSRIFKLRSMKDIWYLARAVVRFRRQLIKGRKFTFINNVPGITGTQIALKYVLDNQNVTSAVFGTTTMSHLEDNMKALEILIPKNIYSKIKETGK